MTPTGTSPGDVEAAEEAAARADAEVELLEEQVRDGNTEVTAKQLAEAKAMADHAHLVVEAARRYADKAEASAREKAIEAAESRRANPEGRARIEAAQRALQEAAGELAAAVKAFNDHELSAFTELVHLHASGYTSLAAHAALHDLGRQVAIAIAAGVGVNRLRAHSQHSGVKFAAAVNTAAKGQ